VVKHNLTCKPCAFPSDFNLDDYRIFQGTPQRILYDNDCIDIGNRRISVIHTPGHSPGHCCFYEPQRKFLYSGDLIYKGCLDAFYPTTDPQIFWQSVKKVQLLEIEQILPAHYGLDVTVDIIGRIEKAFRKLSDENDLKQGSGIFDFNDFQIHI
jgi:glyoxylase-like metal-dependent hydrolase (beta-lactamase superfamily II)